MSNAVYANVAFPLENLQPAYPPTQRYTTNINHCPPQLLLAELCMRRCRCRVNTAALKRLRSARRVSLTKRPIKLSSKARAKKSGTSNSKVSVTELLGFLPPTASIKRTLPRLVSPLTLRHAISSPLESTVMRAFHDISIPRENKTHSDNILSCASTRTSVNQGDLCTLVSE